jgi:murein DD-endopeptidase MepM/ murein hydrolase activator NlpD
METIAEMNKDYMENGVNSTIHVGQSLIITVPEPELAVEWVNREHYSETFEADVEYVDNDEWFTNQTQVLQQPVAGYRELIADVHYSNDDEVSREIVKQDVLMEAVPKIVERGTMIPPTFIWPLSGGRISSYFGRRKSPTAGASSYHKGIDIATPTGSSVYASSGGVVTSAGWNGGYGYAVVIRHPDGHSTRYGHLSKILVSVGQSVSQGQTIARSGSTGVSTGPHLHFEIIENGVQVDPLPFLR